mmetsp:Transcript_29816/g.95400  ORF Transcript_29816/g.95400 Transcript_29816/m.95400 type:complete len:442 (+) Transcript_29816:116-1441(+)
MAMPVVFSHVVPLAAERSHTAHEARRTASATDVSVSQLMTRKVTNRTLYALWAAQAPKYYNPHIRLRNSNQKHHEAFTCDMPSSPPDTAMHFSLFKDRIEHDSYYHFTGEGRFRRSSYDKLFEAADAAAWRASLEGFVNASECMSTFVVNVVNYAYKDFTVPWIRMMVRVGTLQKCLMVVALDAETQAACVAGGVAANCFLLADNAELFRAPSMHGAHEARCRGRTCQKPAAFAGTTWYRVGLSKLTMLAELVRLRRNVLFTESDVGWQKDPSSIFGMATYEGDDVVANMEQTWVNVGILGVRANSRTRMFTEALSYYWLMKRPTYHAMDQTLWNLLLSPTLCHTVYWWQTEKKLISADLARMLTNSPTHSQMHLTWQFLGNMKSAGVAYHLVGANLAARLAALKNAAYGPRALKGISGQAAQAGRELRWSRGKRRTTGEP